MPRLCPASPPSGLTLIGALTERLQARNIICPIFIAALIKPSKRKWKYNIKFFKSDSYNSNNNLYYLHLLLQLALHFLKEFSSVRGKKAS